MSKNIGTLIGAPIRVNDSLDTYASAIDNEIKGGRHSVATTTDRDSITTDRRSAGMLCYVIADRNTYQLENDLVTWTLVQGNGGAGGGDNGNVQLISGNFGRWTPLSSLAAEMENTNFVLSYKSDLQAFPTRAITYIQGQFDLNPSFSGTSLLLGTLPANSRPANQIKKYFIFQNIEMFLVVDTNGNVSLLSKDTFNLPVAVSSVQPYYIDLFFNPGITLVDPTVYTATRTASFTKNNCANGYSGSSVSYTKTYTSTVDQGTADNLAATDPDFNSSGQNYANANGTCTVTGNNAFVFNNRNAGSQFVRFTDTHGTITSANSVSPGTSGSFALNPAETYSLFVQNKTGPDLYVIINENAPVLVAQSSGRTFTGLHTPVTVTLTD